MKKMFEQIIPPKTGFAAKVKQGQHFRLITLEGKQVADTVIFNLDNPREKLSSSFSRCRQLPQPGQKYYPGFNVREGYWLMSTICRPMMTFVKETCEPKGVHDAQQRLCNGFLYRVYAGEWRDGCHELISKAIAPYNLLPEDIPDPVTFFMNLPYNPELHAYEMQEPIAKPGDYVELRAEMNCLVALSNCPEDTLTPCNAYRCKPLKAEIYEDESYKPRPILSPTEWLEEELRKRGS